MQQEITTEVSLIVPILQMGKQMHNELATVTQQARGQIGSRTQVHQVLCALDHTASLCLSS